MMQDWSGSGPPQALRWVNHFFGPADLPNSWELPPDFAGKMRAWVGMSLIG